MIGVLGPTGQIGTTLMPALERAGAQVRALAHTPESAAKLEGGFAEVMTGDVRNPDDLARFLDGVSSLFLLTTATPDQTEVQNRIVDAAVAAGVQSIVKLSVYTAAHDALCSLSRWHQENDDYIAQSGLDYTILWPHTWMQSIALQFAPAIKAGVGMKAAVRPDATITLIDARDVAEVAAAVLLKGEHRGETILITGPEALSYPDCAELIGKHIGQPVTYEQLPAEEVYQGFTSVGMPDWLADALVALHRQYDTGELNPMTDAVQEWTGKPARSFAQFLDDHGHLFAPEEATV